MTWDRVSPYCIRSGRYRIAKVYVRGERIYELWRGGWEKLAWSHDPDELKAIAEREVQTDMPSERDPAPTPDLQWDQVSKYTMRSGDYTIATVPVAGKLHYELWERGVRIGFYSTLRTAKEKAVRLAKGAAR